MDSGNSGSLQSSSCGDDDFDSAFFHSTSSAVIGVGGGAVFPPPPPSSTFPYHQFLDSFYLDSSSLLPIDATAPNTAAPWQPHGTLRPSPNCTTTDTFPSLSVVPPSSLSPSSNNSFTSSTRSAVAFSPSPSAPPQEQSAAAAPATATAPAPPARSSKKRTRASRRAPTTVLTTDTSNFRAMVQEFTGIPSPPFAGGASPSPFVRSRLDAIHSAAAGGLIIPPPSYLIRPFPQKFQGPFGSTSNAAIPISSPASSTNSITSTGAATNSMSIANTITTSIPMATTNIVNPTNNYQLPSPGSVLGSQIQSLVHPQNSILNFQSLQQPQLRAKYTPSTMSSPAVPFTSSRLQTMPSSSAEYGSSNLLFPPGLLVGSPEGVRSSWTGHPGSSASIDLARPQSDYVGSSQQRPVGGSTCKMNFSASGSSETGVDRAVENAKAGSRSEGMVESWICSSD